VAIKVLSADFAVNKERVARAHIAWFQEFWRLRHLGGHAPILKQGDDLYDSARVTDDARWNLPLPAGDETLLTCGDRSLTAPVLLETLLRTPPVNWRRWDTPMCVTTAKGSRTGSMRDCDL
jgi:hypothetical protein